MPPVQPSSSRGTRRRRRLGKSGHGLKDESIEDAPNDTPEVLYTKRCKRGLTMKEHLALVPEAAIRAFESHTTLHIEAAPDSGTSLVFTPLGTRQAYQTNHPHVEITNQRGKEWIVDWHNKDRGDPHDLRTNNERHGWSVFLKANGLGVGDFLIFKEIISYKAHIQFGFDVMGRQNRMQKPSYQDATPASELLLVDHPSVEKGHISDGDVKAGAKARPRYREAHAHPYDEEPSDLHKFFYFSDCTLGQYTPAGASRDELQRFADAGWPRELYVPSLTTTSRTGTEGPALEPSKLEVKRRAGAASSKNRGRKERFAQNSSDRKRPRHGRPSKKRDLDKDQGIAQNASPKQPRPRRTCQKLSRKEGKDLQSTSLVTEALMAEPSIDQAEQMQGLYSGPSLRPRDSIQYAGPIQGRAGPSLQLSTNIQSAAEAADNTVYIATTLGTGLQGGSEAGPSQLSKLPQRHGRPNKKPVGEEAGQVQNASDVIIPATGNALPSFQCIDNVNLGPLQGRSGPSLQPSDNNFQSTAGESICMTQTWGSNFIPDPALNQLQIKVDPEPEPEPELSDLDRDIEHSMNLDRAVEHFKNLNCNQIKVEHIG